MHLLIQLVLCIVLILAISYSVQKLQIVKDVWNKVNADGAKVCKLALMII